MRVLYVCHTADISGAERTLLDLLESLPGSVAAAVACPKGALTARLQQRQLTVVHIPPIEGGLRSGVRHTAGAILAIGRASLMVRRAARRLQIDLLDANSIRAGLVATLARRLGGPPVVMHVDDCLPATPTANFTRRFLNASDAVILANSRHTANTFTSGGGRARVRVLYNTTDAARFDPSRRTRAQARHELGVPADTPVFGVVGQLTPWKGQDDAIRILARLRDRWPAAQLLVAGEAKFTTGAARYDNRAYEGRLRQLAGELGVAHAVRFLGEREDMPTILRALDVLLVPSWEEPFGKVILEAMAMAVPVVATDVGGPAEIVRDGVDGLLLPPHQPGRWAGALADLLAQPERRIAMGRSGRERLVDRFSHRAYLDGELAGYAEAMQHARPRRFELVRRPR